MVINIELLKLLIGDKFVIGVSGGVDSMVLLDLICSHRNVLPPFRVVHVNHGISPNANGWADFVAGRCEQLGVPCEVASVALQGGNLEAAARNARYQVFSGCEEKYILLAHHQNDNAENLLLRLFRGAGVNGLEGMKYFEPSWANPEQTLIRPFMLYYGLKEFASTRRDIECYASDNNVSFIEDESNLDTSYDRNYIRKILKTMTTERFPCAIENMNRSMAHLSEANELLEELAAKDIRSISKNDDGAYLDWRLMNCLSEARLKNILIHIVNSCNAKPLSAAQVTEWARNVIDCGMNAKTEVVFGDFVLRKSGRKIVLEKNGAGLIPLT